MSGYLGAGYAFGKWTLRVWLAVRAVGALGRYDYRGTLFGAGADLSYGAALIGYQFRTQVLFLKLLAGIEAEDQSITPRDPENSVQGSAVGLKLAAESWLDLSPLWFASPSMPRTEPRVNNIGAWRGRAIAFRHASRSGLRAARSATRSTTQAEAVPSSSQIFAVWSSRSPAASPENYLEDEPSGYVPLGVYRAF